MIGKAVVKNRRAAALLGALSLNRIAGAAFPVVLVVSLANARGYGPAAAVQGFWVFSMTATAPFRARLLDRIGRERVLIPQATLSVAALLFLAVAATSSHIPWPIALLAAGLSAIVSPSIDAVVRTTWRSIGTDDDEVKALHSFDSILEEAGFLLGPLFASVLMVTVGIRPAVFLVWAAAAAGITLTLSSKEVRSALHSKQKSVVSAADTALPQDVTIEPAPRRIVRTLAGPIASRELQRIVAPLILMGTVFGILAILVPAMSAAAGSPGDAGFVLACISLGGVVGALVYATITWAASLRLRQAVLGLIFGTPLLAGFAAHQLWLLGVLLVAAGLVVTPLYINSYLMMDKEIPDDVIHEANTWVPVGNNVGYLLGITLAGVVIGRGEHIEAGLQLVTATAAVFVAYSVLQVVWARQATQTAAGSPPAPSAARAG
ncbi:MFS transporter [Jatrophihabitans lederbergiae]|uniref:MFS transporter n=1 Tax=Jatrophihabitans lederbergiae TaxID=3075547 RepID=A0ABU2JF89_9ACTN|nr:MFS transporter [Jatrophihabitans sp. DSM 44399]MDT0263119.1 hypothetical protein [Jatrophihabitans sp. DSM 44399]